MGVLNGGSQPLSGRGEIGDFSPHWFEWRIECIFVFDSYVRNRQYFRTDNISLEASIHWLSENVVNFEIELGLQEICKNVNSDLQRNRTLLQPSREVNVVMAMIAFPFARFFVRFGLFCLVCWKI